MANFRNFILYNAEKSESIDLNNYNGYLVTAPEGIGIYLVNSYFDVGSKRILTKQKSEFRPIRLLIDIFSKTRDELEIKYSSLTSFISRNMDGGFKLEYTPRNGAQARYIECDIKEVDKTQKSTSRMMVFPIIVQPRTLWRIDETSESSVQEALGGNMWSFDEDTNIYGVTEYDVLTGEITGEQEISVYGYDKSQLPDGVFLTINGTKIMSSDFEETDGVFIARKYTGEECITVKFDIANASFTAEVQSYSYEAVGNATFTATSSKSIANGNEGYLYQITFADADVPFEKVLSSGEKIAKGVKYYTYLLKTGAATAPALTINKYDYVIGDDVAYSIGGSLYQGESNFVEAFDYDTTVFEYNIAMFSGASAFNSIVNDGDKTIPLRIRIFGIASNPFVKIIPKGKTEPIQTVKINYTIPAGAYIEIDSDPETSGAWLHLQGGSVLNAISLLDQTTNMFITLPRGEFDIQITDDNSNSVLTTIFYKKEYYGAS